MQQNVGGQVAVCPGCGGALRLSHRRYLGSGRSVAVRRCDSCAREVEGRAEEDAGRANRRQQRSRKPLPDEGPPPNPVLDDDLARRLRESLGQS